MKKKDAKRQFVTFREGQEISVRYRLSATRTMKLRLRVTAEGSGRYNRFVLLGVTTSTVSSEHRHGLWPGALLSLTKVLNAGRSIERIESRQRQ